MKTKNLPSEKILETLLCQSSLMPNISRENPLRRRHFTSLTLSAQGLSTEACAEILGLSRNTVQSYEQEIRELLQVKNKMHALYEALRLNYVTMK